VKARRALDGLKTGRRDRRQGCPDNIPEEVKISHLDREGGPKERSVGSGRKRKSLLKQRMMEK